MKIIKTVGVTGHRSLGSAEEDMGRHDTARPDVSPIGLIVERRYW